MSRTRCPTAIDSTGAGGDAPPEKHTVSVGSVPFEVDTCYTPLRMIGRGAYGLVCAAHAHPSVRPPPAEGDEESDDGCVAIKKIKAIFAPGANLIEAKRTLREICLLQHMRHENVLGIRDVLLPSCAASFADAYLVLEKMDSDMHRIIQASQARRAGGPAPSVPRALGRSRAPVRRALAALCCARSARSRASRSLPTTCASSSTSCCAGSSTSTARA